MVFSLPAPSQLRCWLLFSAETSFASKNIPTYHQQVRRVYPPRPSIYARQTRVPNLLLNHGPPPHRVYLGSKRPSPRLWARPAWCQGGRRTSPPRAPARSLLGAGVIINRHPSFVPSHPIPFHSIPARTTRTSGSFVRSFVRSRKDVVAPHRTTNEKNNQQDVLHAGESQLQGGGGGGDTILNCTPRKTT